MTLNEEATQEPYLRIMNITKTFGELVALKDISLDVVEGEFVCFLGPSGCGKTTLLRIIAGLEQQNVGRIFQSGKDISRLPPRDRDFGIVFQSYALFPNLTASQNIAYGLENQKATKRKIKERVEELLELVGLPEIGYKYPSQLSGGQKQRIALARALATSPGLLLLDEPLSALDARVRVALRLEIKHLQERLGVTTIFVTHDQEEALVMADRIVVMSEGVIEQVGAPEEIYRLPSTPFVADFVGQMNFLPGLAGPGENQVRCGNSILECDYSHGFSVDRPVMIAIRPEDVRVGNPNQEHSNTILCRVDEMIFLGSFYRLLTLMPDITEPYLVAEISNNRMRDLDIKYGSEVSVYLPAPLIRVYPDGRKLSL
jgi:iron(III) transport system ATP-binding protein